MSNISKERLLNLEVILPPSRATRTIRRLRRSDRQIKIGDPEEP